MTAHKNHRLTNDEQVKILGLADKGVKLKDIVNDVGVKFNTAFAFLKRSGRLQPSYNPVGRVVNSEKVIKRLKSKIDLAEERLTNLKIGSNLTLLYMDGPVEVKLSGVVEKKYDDKLIMRNKQNRIEMITLADLLTMKVIDD